MDHRHPHRCASLFFGRDEEGGELLVPSMIEALPRLTLVKVGQFRSTKIQNDGRLL
jgi:hypothetical protein